MNTVSYTHLDVYKRQVYYRMCMKRKEYHTYDEEDK